MVPVSWVVVRIKHVDCIVHCPWQVLKNVDYQFLPVLSVKSQEGFLALGIRSLGTLDPSAQYPKEQ